MGFHHILFPRIVTSIHKKQRRSIDLYHNSDNTHRIYLYPHEKDCCYYSFYLYSYTLCFLSSSIKVVAKVGVCWCCSKTTRRETRYGRLIGEDVTSL